MKRQKIEALIPILRVKITGFRNGWVEAYCPFGPWKHDNGHSHPGAFGIFAATNKKSTFKCFSCGAGGDLMDLQVMLSMAAGGDSVNGLQLDKSLELVSSEFEEIEFDPNIKDYEDSAVTVAEPYPEWWLDSFKSAWDFEDARTYLRTRDVNKSLVAALSVRYDPTQQRVCFPYRDQHGALMGMQGRDITGLQTPRYYFYAHKGTRNMQYWLGEHHVDFDKPVVLCEGPFDYASTYRVYQNVLASFSAGISPTKLKRVSDATEIITFYDKGKGGDSARELIHKRMHGIPVLDVIPENSGGDPGSMSRDEVEYHLKEHLSLS